MKYLKVTVDVNDGDYVTEINPISNEKLATLLPFINHLAKYKHEHNWQNVKTQWTGDPKLIEQFADYVPYPPEYNGDNGAHTIENVHVFEVTNVEELF